MSLALSPTMDNAPTIQTTLPSQPFPDSPRSIDFSALGFVLGLLSIITVPALIYTFFFTIKCPPNPFRQTRRTSDEISISEIETPNNSSREAVSDFKYKKETHMKDTGTDCPVCLSVFSDGEEVKQLSACKHLFHKSCIDVWLNSHSNCPVCRASVPVKRPIDQQNNTNSRVSSRVDDEFHQGLPDAANLV